MTDSAVVLNANKFDNKEAMEGNYAKTMRKHGLNDTVRVFDNVSTLKHTQKI